jgi:hypothetical protein
MYRISYVAASLCEAIAETRANAVPFVQKCLANRIFVIGGLTQHLPTPLQPAPTLKCAMSIKASFRETGFEVILSEF